MHSFEVFLGQVQDEASLPAPPLPTSGPRAQAHLPTPRGLQHCGWTEVHQEADRHANIHHDQGYSQKCSGQGARDQQSDPESGLQQRPIRAGVRVEHQPQPDGGQGQGAPPS